VALDTFEGLKQQETPIKESLKFFHLRAYLINAKKIRETWMNTSKGKNQTNNFRED